MVEQTQKLGSWLCNQCLLISNSSEQVFIEIYGVVVTILCVAEDEKDEFEITPIFKEQEEETMLKRKKILISVLLLTCWVGPDNLLYLSGAVFSSVS